MYLTPIAHCYHVLLVTSYWANLKKKTISLILMLTNLILYRNNVTFYKKKSSFRQQINNDLLIYSMAL